MIRARPNYRALWPIPTLALSLALLAGGVVTLISRIPSDDPAAPLLKVRAALEAGEHEKALQLLNGELLESVRIGRLPKKPLADFYLFRARALDAAQRALGSPVPANMQLVDKSYEEARDNDAHLAPADLIAFAAAALGHGNAPKAVDLARSLPPDNAADKFSIYRAVIDHNLRQRDVRYDLTLGLLSELMDAPKASDDDRAWALARQTELRLASGYHEEAIARLLRAMPRFASLSRPRRGELLLMLGQAYVAADDLAAAQPHLRQAEELLTPEAGDQLSVPDPRRAEATVQLARIMQRSGENVEARDRLTQIRERFPDSPVTLPAILSLAEVCAALDDHDAAADHFSDLIKLLQGGLARREVTPELVGQSLLERFQGRVGAEDHPRALRYATLAEQAFKVAGRIPPAVPLALAQTHRRLGLDLLNSSRQSDSGVIPISQVSPVAQAEIKKHLLSAGDSFRSHARDVLVTDADAYFRSLWDAADSYDLAGDRPAAKESFGQYLQDAPDQDARKSEARFRLGLIFEAERDLTAALDQYSRLIDGRDSAGRAAAGPLADAARVPRARVLRAQGTAESIAAAEQDLQQVLGGNLVEPDSTIFRDALMEMGDLAFDQGRYADAIRRLGDAVRLYPDHPRVNTNRFKLAEAHRLAATQITETLKGKLQLDQRDRLVDTRRQYLRDAQRLYREVIVGVDAKDNRRRSALERIAHRNSHFYLGDAAFELGDYAEAIRIYDAARQRFMDDPASLVAMVQIVNAYVAQQRWNEAITANERARQQLAALPAGVWDNPDLPMTRQHWERWLASTAALETRARSVAAAPDSAGPPR